MKRMNIKIFSSLIAISLGLSLGSSTISPSHASELTDHTSDEILISQLRGHNTYDGRPQIRWDDDDYSVGTVVGGSGGLLSIVVEDGTLLQAEGDIRLGSNVLVAPDENGDYFLVKASESEWILPLEQDYGVKRNKDYPAPLAERTAPIWASF